MCAVASAVKQRVLVLGGSGFVGSHFVEGCLRRDIEVVSVSRRGKPANNLLLEQNKVQWVKGDMRRIEEMENIYEQYGPFTGVFHSIGLLFDKDSGLQSFNKYASGSNSVPASDATYDDITRVTAINALNIISNKNRDGKRIPFIFVSAAEAAWTFPAPVNFLERYLIAKRAVEKAVLNSADVRGVVLRYLCYLLTHSLTRSLTHYFRPSLIWSLERPQALISVIPFYIAASINVPFVDKPVLVSTLVNAAINSMLDEETSGIKSYKEMEALSSRRI